MNVENAALTTKQVAALVGRPEATVYSWKRQGLLVPSWPASKTEGRGELYSFSDLVGAHLLATWQDVKPAVTARIVKFLQRTKCKTVGQYPVICWINGSEPECVTSMAQATLQPGQVTHVYDLGALVKAIRRELPKKLRPQPAFHEIEVAAD